MSENINEVPANVPDAPESPVDPTQKTPVVINSNVYDAMKSFVQVVMPALITFYLFLGDAYNWENVETNAGAAGAFTVFLGILIGWLSNNFQKAKAVKDAIEANSYDGAIYLRDDPKTQTVATGFDFGRVDPRTLIEKDTLKLKVNPNQ